MRVRQVLRGIRAMLAGWLGLPRRRGEYRSTWDAAAASLEAAKVSIAGYSDEREFERTGKLTLAMLEETVGIGPEDVVLEIGAGIGRVGRHVAPRCRAWIATDASPRMLAYLEKRLADLSNVRAVPTSGYDLSPIASESVDVVYATVVFMHLDEWERYRYVAEGMRVLRPGGRMLVDNVNLASDEGWAFFLRTLEEYPPSERPPQISRSSTAEELRTYFSRAGFADIRERRDGLWLAVYGRKPPSPFNAGASR